ncbi:MAG: hypothetical protein M9899_07670 [Bdellovibrionaceae bacterium]|nr:hypothetical protein [Pseudobdellovibrionaceae bacterium]
MCKMTFVFLMLSFFYMPKAYACRMDQPPTYKVNLSYDKMIKNDMVIELVEVESNKKEYLLDDTGYLGAYLAFARLTTNKDAETVKLFKERLDKLKSSLMPYDNGLEISKKIKELKSISSMLDSETITTKELIVKWLELKSTLDKNELQILVRQKKALNQEWSAKEINVEQVRLPAYSIPNARGCSGRLTGFKLQ